jgi:hypothetical protein
MATNKERIEKLESEMQELKEGMQKMSADSQSNFAASQSNFKELNGAFSKRIFKNKYDSDIAFFKNKSYFIQLFQKQIIFYSTFF